jgi:hypothetical protein
MFGLSGGESDYGLAPSFFNAVSLPLDVSGAPSFLIHHATMASYNVNTESPPESSQILPSQVERLQTSFDISQNAINELAGPISSLSWKESTVGTEEVDEPTMTVSVVTPSESQVIEQPTAGDDPEVEPQYISHGNAAAGPPKSSFLDASSPQFQTCHCGRRFESHKRLQ